MARNQIGVFMSNQIRLQKYIADCGITSRRKAEVLIEEGRIKVNGRLITELGTKVDPELDVVQFDGVTLSKERIEPVYLVFNKPRGVMTTVHDPEGRKTVMDFLPRLHQRVYPVGRLDYHSEGLLILTNDGEMAHKIMHPSFEVTKVYEVKVFGAVTPDLLKELKKARQFAEGPVKPKSVRIIQQLPTKTWLEFRLNEGRNREIRRICEEVGLTIDKLRRVAIEGLSINGIAPGKFDFISKKELQKLLGMSEPAPDYVSPKRTIHLSQKGAQATRKADDGYFLQYRGENYLKTMKKFKEAKAERDGARS